MNHILYNIILYIPLHLFDNMYLLFKKHQEQPNLDQSKF